MQHNAAHFGLRPARNYTHYESCYCPYHGDTNPSAIFLKNEGIFFCYVCRVRKTLDQLAKEFNIDYVASSSFLNLPTIDLLKPSTDSRYYESCVVDNDSIDYLLHRNIRIETALRYGLEYDTMGRSIVFPQIILEYLMVENKPMFKSRRIGSVHRATPASGVKTRYAIIGERTPLWPLKIGVEMFEKRESVQLILSEGYFKTMMIAQAAEEIGWSNLVSMCIQGSHPNSDTTSLAHSLSAVPIYVVDNDESGRACGAYMKKSGMRCVVPSCPFDDMSLEEACDALDNLRSRFESGSMF